MKNKLLIGAMIAVSMNVSYADEIPGGAGASARPQIAQADAVLKGAGSDNADKKQATGATGSDRKPQTATNMADRTFAEKAVEANAREIQLSETALEKATSDDVKQYAKRMVEEHSSSNEQLMSAINSTISEQWRPKKNADQAKLKEVKNLRALSGEKFDRQYMAMMVKEHAQAVKLYEKEAKSGKTPELKAFAEKTLPSLQEHLKMAREVSQKVGGSGGTAK